MNEHAVCQVKTSKSIFYFNSAANDHCSRKGLRWIFSVKISSII